MKHYEITVRQNNSINPAALGFSINDLTRGVNDLLNLLRQAGPVLETVNRNTKQIEAIIRIASGSEAQVKAIVDAAAKLAPVITVAVKQIEPLTKPAPGQDKSPIQKYVGVAAWIAENPVIVGTAFGTILLFILFSGGYAFYQLAKKKEK